jgi:F420-dependent oxidoreductase-like protein
MTHLAQPVVRLGFTYSTYTHPGVPVGQLFDRIAGIAVAAESAGFDSVWVPDHFMQTPVVAPPSEPMLECYTTLGALAARTERVRLGAFVGAAAYRNAALLGKVVTTLDVISSGRAIFGIGAGWYEDEHDAYGYDFGTIGERFTRLEEVLSIVRSMFTTGSTSLAGRSYRANGALNVPGPVQPGGPPILIGGSGEKRTLRLVARYADICNVTGGPDRIRHLMDVLDRHCEDVGRKPAEICRTAVNMVIIRDTYEEAERLVPDAYRRNPAHVRPIMGTADHVAGQLRQLLDAGLDGLIVGPPHADQSPEYVAVLADTCRAALAG